MEVHKLYNANVYLDGSLNLLGRASEIMLPDVQATVDEHRALGMIGPVQLPTGLEKLVAKIKWSSFYGDVLAKSFNVFQSYKLQVKASRETHGAGGRTEEVPVVCSLTVKWTKVPLGGFKAGEHQEREDELSVSYLKLTENGRDLVEIDLFENTYLVDGVDVLAAYNKNLGG